MGLLDASLFIAACFPCEIESIKIYNIVVSVTTFESFNVKRRGRTASCQENYLAKSMQLHALCNLFLTLCSYILLSFALKESSRDNVTLSVPRYVGITTGVISALSPGRANKQACRPGIRMTGLLYWQDTSPQHPLSVKRLQYQRITTTRTS